MVQFRLGGTDWQDVPDAPPSLDDWLSNTVLKQRLSRFVVEDPDRMLLDYLQAIPEQARRPGETAVLTPNDFSGEYETIRSNLSDSLAMDDEAKFVVFEGAERLGNERQGATLAALLSVLENPPNAEGVVVIIATTSLDTLPDALCSPARVEAVFTPETNWLTSTAELVQSTWDTAKKQLSDWL